MTASQARQKYPPGRWPRPPAEQRFWSRVNKTDTCWLWTGSVNQDGYGRFPFNGKTVRAHRWAYELERGPVPEGLVIDHLCRVRNCVNPAHMEVVTPRTNNLRGIGPAAVNAVKATCPYGHEYVVIAAVGGGHQRGCRECTAARARRYRRRLREQHQ